MAFIVPLIGTLKFMLTMYTVGLIKKSKVPLRTGRDRATRILSTYATRNAKLSNEHFMPKHIAVKVKMNRASYPILQLENLLSYQSYL
jgi:hypothetical protein